MLSGGLLILWHSASPPLELTGPRHCSLVSQQLVRHWSTLSVTLAVNCDGCSLTVITTQCLRIGKRPTLIYIYIMCMVSCLSTITRWHEMASMSIKKLRTSTAILRHRHSSLSVNYTLTILWFKLSQLWMNALNLLCAVHEGHCSTQ